MSNSVTDPKLEKEQGIRQKKSNLSKKDEKPREPNKESGWFWVGQEGGFKSHLNKVIPINSPDSELIQEFGYKN